MKVLVKTQFERLNEKCLVGHHMFGSVKRLIIDTISMLLTPTEMYQIGIMPSSENNAELLVSLNPHRSGSRSALEHVTTLSSC